MSSKKIPSMYAVKEIIKEDPHYTANISSKKIPSRLQKI